MILLRNNAWLVANTRYATDVSVVALDNCDMCKMRIATHSPLLYRLVGYYEWRWSSLRECKAACRRTNKVNDSLFNKKLPWRNEHTNLQIDLFANLNWKYFVGGIHCIKEKNWSWNSFFLERRFSQNSICLQFFFSQKQFFFSLKEIFNWKIFFTKWKPFWEKIFYSDILKYK